jgi:hypothetical protein
MYILLRYPVGIIVEAVVLSEGRNRMRVAVAGFPDTIELKRYGQQWFTATRQPVEFDFLLSNARLGGSVSSSRRACAARAAGSGRSHDEKLM